MPDVREELRDLEGKIQILPWTGQTPDVTNPQTMAWVKSWLMLKGMSKQKLDNIQAASAAKSYAVKNYYDVVAGNRPKGLNYKAERVLSQSVDLMADDEAAPPPTYNTSHNYEAIKETPEPRPGMSSSELADIEYRIENKLAKKLTDNLEIHLDKIIQTHTQAQAAQTEISLVHKFNSGEIKVQFSDQAKSDLKSLVIKTATDFLAQNLPPKETIIKIPEKNISTNVGYVHREFPTLITALGCKLHVMLVGMASSSKTTSAKIAAKSLDLPFYHMGAAANEHKYAGYEDANGNYHTTPFRMAFENGGIILLDEYDASVPSAQMFIQAALANYTCHFPDGIIEAHEDFLCIAGSNTFGRGSDRQYTARNQQDAANLDRFVVLNWDIDEDLESQLFGDGRKYWTPETSNYMTTPPEHQTLSPGDWVRRVQQVRHAIMDLGERHLVTMRCSDFGSRLLQAGMSLAKVEEMCMWKGLNPSTVEKIKHHAKL